jgi:hypothetical protein
VVSGATAWFSCSRGYNAAYAAPGNNNACTLRRQSDNTTITINILSTGLSDVASAATFAGTDATATCTVSATTATCSGASSTPTAQDQVYGTGITNPCVATAIGTFTGGAGTVTLSLPNGNSCGTVSVGETLTFQVALFASQTTDQTGNGHSQLQSTNADQPQFLFKCFSSIPCLETTNASQLMASWGSFTPHAAATFSAEYGRVKGTAAVAQIIGENGSGNRIGTGGSANLTNLRGGSTGTATATATDGVMHAVNDLLNASLSAINVDGTSTSVNETGAVTAGTIGTFAGAASTVMLYGEVGFWDNNTSASLSGLCHNQYLFYGNATSC